MRVDNDVFLEKLTTLLDTAKSTGSVYLEQKRLAKTGPDPKLDATQRPFPLLFRATDGVKDKSKRLKIDTVVEAKNIEQFWSQYADVLKAGMHGLLRKDKKEKKKKKKKQA